MQKRTCKDCGREFTLTDSEIKFYKDKNLELPKRCSECRNARKNKINNEKKIDKIEKIEPKTSTNFNNNGKTIRNIIIAAIVLISSFFGIKLNFFQGYLSSNNDNNTAVQQNYSLTFRNDKLLEEHFKKHGSEFNYKDEDQYVKGAIAVINSPSSLHKTEKEDGDEIYYDEEKNEIVFVSKDGFIRTYFKPNDGIKYYNRQ